MSGSGLEPAPAAASAPSEVGAICAVGADTIKSETAQLPDLAP
jgi:hypothetical protein